MNIPAFLTYVVLTTFTPGPNNIMSLSNANRFGFRKTLNFIFGVAAGFTIIMTLCAFFNLILFNYIPGFKSLVGFIGALYMLYLAFSIINEDDEDLKPAGFNSNSFTAGMTLQFINPKVIIFGITAHSVFIIPYFNSNLHLILFSIFLAFSGLISTAVWALFGSMMRQLLAVHRQKFNIIMAILLVYCAVSVSGLSGI